MLAAGGPNIMRSDVFGWANGTMGARLGWSTESAWQHLPKTVAASLLHAESWYQHLTWRHVCGARLPRLVLDTWDYRNGTSCLVTLVAVRSWQHGDETEATLVIEAGHVLRCSSQS